MLKAIKSRLRGPGKKQSAHAEHEVDCTSLCCAKTGSTVCVTEICGCELEASKLRDIGIREGAIVKVVRHGNPILVRIEDARFGVGEIAATNVLCEYVK